MADGHQIRNQDAIHFITLTIVGWIDLFTSAACREIIIKNLRFCQQNKGLVIYCYVIMSNHIHLICHAKEEYRLSDILRDFKSFTAKSMIQTIQQKEDKRLTWLLQSFAFHARFNKRNGDFQVWKQSNHPIELESPFFINQKLNYIHNNPVRARIVDLPNEYVFSSARDYLGIPGILHVEILDVGNDIGYISM
ncbi:MAG: transposase [Saprospiraceae bacterium]